MDNMNNEPEYKNDKYGNKFSYLNKKRHREDGPAIETASGTKYWFLNDKKVHPETIVDLWLARGVFCYYDEQNQSLNFGAQQ